MELLTDNDLCKGKNGLEGTMRCNDGEGAEAVGDGELQQTKLL